MSDAPVANRTRSRHALFAVPTLQDLLANSLPPELTDEDYLSDNDSLYIVESDSDDDEAPLLPFPPPPLSASAHQTDEASSAPLQQAFLRAFHAASNACNTVIGLHHAFLPRRPYPSPLFSDDIFHPSNDELRLVVLDKAIEARLLTVDEKETQTCGAPPEPTEQRWILAGYGTPEYHAHSLQRLTAKLAQAYIKERETAPPAFKERTRHHDAFLALIQQNFTRAWKAAAADPTNKPLAPQDTSIPCPNKIEEAIDPSHPEHEKWTTALATEWSRLCAKGTWRALAEEENGLKAAVSSKYALRKSLQLDGTYKFKVRLVARGFSQQPGVDYDETFAPTASYQAFCIMVSLMARNDWDANHVDVENAFIEADLDRAIVMQLPTLNNVDGRPTKVMLLKSLYGLKQAGMLWFKLLTKNLNKLGAKQLVHDQCIFRFQHPDTGVVTWVVVYVDDIIFMGPSREDIDMLTSGLGATFNRITVQPEVSKFLGIELVRDRENRRAFLTQGQLIDLLFSSAKIPRKYRAMPLNPNINLHKLGDGTEPTMHSEGGSFRYLADRCYPDILPSAGLISRGAHKPSPLHRRGWRHILQYLDAHRDEGLCLGGKGEIRLFAFADASSSVGDDSKAQLGFCFFLDLHSGAILARSKRSTTVVSSSTEGELQALAECARQTVWTRGFLEEVGHPQSSPTVIYTDSQSAMAMVKTGSSTSRANHLVRVYNYLCQEVTAGNVDLKYITAEDQVADILTKPLSAEISLTFAHKLKYGFDGVEPESGNVSDPHQLRLRQLSRMRAAKRRLARVTAQPAARLATTAHAFMMALPVGPTSHPHQVRFTFRHNLRTIFRGEVQQATCRGPNCTTPTCIGFEYCNPCLQPLLHLFVGPCRLNNKRETGLFANNGQPVDRSVEDKARRRTNGQSANPVVFQIGAEICDYRGERLPSIASMHERYGGGPGPYCFEFTRGALKGQIIDAALLRGIGSLANHGKMNVGVGVQANCELHSNDATGRVWLQAIKPILNGDQIILSYARRFQIQALADTGYTFQTAS